MHVGSSTMNASRPLLAVASPHFSSSKALYIAGTPKNTLGL